MSILDNIDLEAGRQAKMFPPGNELEERKSRRDRKALVDYFVQQQKERRMARGIDTPSDQDPAINPDALLNRNFSIPRQLHGGGGLMYEGGERFGKSPHVPAPARREENWQRALDLLLQIAPGLAGRALKTAGKLPIFRGSKGIQLPLFKRLERSTD